MTEASIMGFLSQSSVTVTSTTQDYSSFEAWRLQPESGISGIITTSAALKAGVILSVTLLEKDINDPEYIIANRKMEIGLVESSDRHKILNEEYISKSKLPVKKNIFEEFLNPNSFSVGQSVGVMVNNGELYTFINGVNVDVIQSESFIGGRLCGVINIAGRCLRVKIEILDRTESLSLMCLKTMHIPVKSDSNETPRLEELTYGTIVKVKCYPDWSTLSNITNNWIIEIDEKIHNISCDQKIRASVPSKYLQLLPLSKAELDEFNLVVRDCINEKVSGRFSILKIFCVGSPGVGKTSLKHTLQGKPLPERYNSTHLADKTDRIYTSTHSTLSRNGSSTEWVDYGYDQHVKQISSIAAHRMRLGDTAKPQNAGDGQVEAEVSEVDIHNVNDSHSQTQHVDLPQQQLQNTSASGAGTSTPLVDDKQSISDETLLFSSIRNTCALNYNPDIVSQIDAEKAIEHIFFTDCGGQPQFIDALPTFMKGSMVLMIVINLNQNIHSALKFSYHIDGKDISMPGQYSSLTTLQLIQTIAYSVAAFRNNYERTSGLCSRQYYMIIATHVDKVKLRSKKLSDTNILLQNALQSTLDNCIKFGDESEIIFPISTINDRERVSEMIREKIAYHSKENGRIVSIPVRWHTFEIRILDFCRQKKRKILSFDECYQQVALSAEVQISDKEELKEVIEHYCQVNFFLYFSFLPDFVFCDSQLVLDIISTLLKVSFSKLNSIPSHLNSRQQSCLRDFGIFNEYVLEICVSQVLSGHEKEINFDHKNVVTILENLNLIAKVSDDEFFLPCALQSCAGRNLHRLKNEFKNDCFDPLLLFPVSKLVPLGLFSSVIVCLLNKKKDLLSINKNTNQFNNAITLEYKSVESGIKEEVLLCTNEIEWLEIRYLGHRQNDATHIQEIFTEILSEVCKTLPYDKKKIAFSYGFSDCIWPSSNKEHKKPHPCKVVSTSPITVQCMQNPTFESSRKTLKQPMANHIGKISWLLTEDQMNYPGRNSQFQHNAVGLLKSHTKINAVDSSMKKMDTDFHLQVSTSTSIQGDSHTRLSSSGQCGNRENRSFLVIQNSFNESNLELEKTRKRIDVIKKAQEKAQEKAKRVRVQLGSKNEYEFNMKIYTTLDLLLEERQRNCIDHLRQLERLQDCNTKKASEEEGYQRKAMFSQFSKAHPQHKSGNFSSNSEDSLYSYQHLLDSQLELYEKTDVMIEDVKGLLRVQQPQMSEVVISCSKEHTETMLDQKNIPRSDLTLHQELNRGRPGFTVHVGYFKSQQQVEIKQTLNREYDMLLDQEISVMSKLRHPNIIQFIGICSESSSDPLSLVMEMIELSLKEVYEQYKLKPDGELPVLKDIAAGLHYLHYCHNIIHCDINSSNILLVSTNDGQWRAKLSEFGSAMSMTQPTAYSTSLENSDISTAVYRAPEIGLGKHLTTKVDVFSFGILSCEGICSEYPDQSKLADMQRRVSIVRPRIGQLIELCIKKEPEKRPTITMVIAELDTEHRLVMMATCS